MNINYRIFLLFVLLVFMCSCKSIDVETYPNYKNTEFRIPDSVNTKMNNQFVRSRKSFVGKIEPLDLKKLYNSLEKSFKTELPRNKSVLINYKQRGNNCFDYEYESLVKVTRNIKRISNRMSETYNIQDFFVYSKEAYNRDFYESTDYYLEDFGFLRKNIFTLEEVCSAFFLVKPNGEFLKFYGTDYFSEIKKFMESELIYTQN